jgi:membrane protease YdiL (CAAX protease family)
MVFLVSMFKFMIGPTTGIFSGLGLVETALLAGSGMTLSVLIFSSGGLAIRDWWFAGFRHDRKLFSPRNRRIVRFYSRFGLPGMALLTPVVFSPIVGTLLAISFGERKERVLFWMAASAYFWGFILSFVFSVIHS